MRFISLVILLFARVASSSSLVASTKQLRHKHAGATFISSLEFKLSLRICNAYPYSYPMDVYLGKEKLTASSLLYKKCAQFSPSLKVGDKLDFKIGDSSAGSFTVSELPANDAVLVIVIFRHDTLSTAVSFESHVFANLMNAQIAVLDTYRGAAQAVPLIRDVKTFQNEKNHVQRSEELRYDSVVAVNQGLYEVMLKGSQDGKTKATAEFVALDRESYMVIRCGVEAQQGQAFPQDLMIFPESDASKLSGAAGYSLFGAALVALYSLVC